MIFLKQVFVLQQVVVDGDAAFSVSETTIACRRTGGNEEGLLVVTWACRCNAFFSSFAPHAFLHRQERADRECAPGLCCLWAIEHGASSGLVLSHAMSAIKSAVAAVQFGFDAAGKISKFRHWVDTGGLVSRAFARGSPPLVGVLPPSAPG